MKKSRFTGSGIMAMLNQAQAGTPVPELCCEHGISSASHPAHRRLQYPDVHLEIEDGHADLGAAFDLPSAVAVPTYVYLSREQPHRTGDNFKCNPHHGL